MSRATIERNWTAHGLDCVVLGIDMGHRCGYVRVPDDHPWFGKDYDAQVEKLRDPSEDTVDDHGIVSVFCAAGSDDYFSTPNGQIAVHGGITFAGKAPHPDCAEGWWFGFDCAHSGDGKDRALMSDRHREFDDRFYGDHPQFAGLRDEEHVWTEDEVAAECERMAEQIGVAP